MAAQFFEELLEKPWPAPEMLRRAINYLETGENFVVISFFAQR